MHAVIYNVDQLEALRQLGRAVADVIARMRREQGNALWARAQNATGPQATQLLLQAERKWGGTVNVSRYESAAAFCNMAALDLKRKRYAVAMLSAGNVLNVYREVFMTHAKSYAELRTASAAAFRTGKHPEPSMDAMHSVPVEMEDAFSKLLTKSFCRIGQANVALCHEALRGRGKMTPQNLQETRSHRDQARERKLKRAYSLLARL